METLTIYITDKSGKKFFRTTVTELYARGERNNIARKFECIKAKHPSFAFIDADTAEIIEEID